MTVGIVALRTMLDDYPSTTSAIAEAQLFAAYSPNVVSEPCSCGGAIACFDTTEQIRIAVEAHNATDVHRAWRVRRG